MENLNISKDAKIKHIRHTYTCYEKHTKEFYRDNYGISLRNQLNEFISDLVDGVYTIADLKAYNKKLKEKLKTANDNFINDKRLLSQVQETIKLIEEPNTKEVKAFETKNAVENGAKEIDMVINIGKAKEHNLYNARFIASTKNKIQSSVDFENLLMAFGEFTPTDQCPNLIREIKNAKKELTYLPKYDYLVLNDKLDISVENVKSIIRAERLSIRRYNKTDIERCRFFVR